MSYEPETYGERIAVVYDALLPPRIEASTELAVEFLAGLAGSGPVLELGIGTGRIALPLASRGIAVHGIDASESMIARLREKPGGPDIPITMGDFQSVSVAGEFRLIYVVFNTFFALLSQDDQLDCFARVAEHLTPRGAFVMEVFVPDPTMYDRGQRVSTTRVETDRMQIDAATHDPVSQRITSQHVLIGKEGIVLLPVQLRYAWPAELDLMARLAGLELAARYGGWQREAFTATSGSHVSVFTRARNKTRTKTKR
jgi:SAM-dependent methyltransferase